MKYLILLLLILNTSIVRANICADLFSNSRPSESEIIQAVLELHGLNVKSYSDNKREAIVAQSLFTQKLSELQTFIPREEIRERMKLIKPDSSGELYLSTISASNDRAIKEMIVDDILKDLDVYSIDEKNLYSGLNALMHASKSADKVLVDALVSNGADVNVKDINGYTPPIMVLGTKSPQVTEIAKILISSGADVNAKVKNGHTALMFATHNNHTQVVELLKKAGAVE